MDIRRFKPLNDAGLATYVDIARGARWDWRTVKKYLAAETTAESLGRSPHALNAPPRTAHAEAATRHHPDTDTGRASSTPENPSSATNFESGDSHEDRTASTSARASPVSCDRFSSVTSGMRIESDAPALINCFTPPITFEGARANRLGPLQSCCTPRWCASSECQSRCHSWLNSVSFLAHFDVTRH